MRCIGSHLQLRYMDWTMGCDGTSMANVNFIYFVAKLSLQLTFGWSDTTSLICFVLFINVFIFYVTTRYNNSDVLLNQLEQDGRYCFLKSRKLTANHRWSH